VAARSLSSRLALSFGLTAAVSLVATAVISFGLVRRLAADQAVDELRRTANAVAAQVGDEIVLEAARFRQLRAVLEASGNELATVGRLGVARADTAEAQRVANAVDLRPLRRGRSSSGFVDVGGSRYAFVAIPARAPGQRLLAGVVLAKRAGVAWAPILQRVLLAAGVAAFLGALVALVIGRRLARPVERVSAATARVAAGDLSQRVPVEGSDELADLARSFNAMSAALSEARRREGEFLSSVSHELRTPLTAIRGYVDALDEGAVRDARGRSEALGVIRTETTRLERLVRDVMDLARLGAQEFRLELRDADLGQVLREAASAHRTEADAANVALTLDEPAGALACRTDPDRIRQVLTNLIENAIRVTPAGGAVTLRGRAEPGAIVLEVSDTGPGIEPEHLPHVFERTYLRTVGGRNGADAAAEPGRPSAGSGLGLAIVRELVRALGGSVDVSSPPGAGSTFRVSLPNR